MPRVYRVPSVERAFRVLEEVGAADGGVTLAELTDRTRYPKTTVFTLILELQVIGALRHDGYRYHLGPVLASLGGKMLARIDVRRVASPYLRTLSKRTKFTTHLGVLNGKELLFIDKVEGDGFIKFSSYPGMSQPFYLSSLGKAIAAFLDDAALEGLLSDVTFERRTEHTTADAAAFRAATALIRAQGYSVEDEENEDGVRCIGAPVFDNFGCVVAAVSATAVRSQLPAVAFPSVAALVVEAADGISGELGYRRDPPIRQSAGNRTPGEG